MCSIRQLSPGGSRLCSHGWGVKVEPEKAEGKIRNTKHAPSKTLGRKHTALVETFLPAVKRHTNAGFSEGWLARSWKTQFLQVSPITSSYPILLWHLHTQVCRVPLDPHPTKWLKETRSQELPGAQRRSVACTRWGNSSVQPCHTKAL